MAVSPADKEAIRDVLAAYAHAVDRRQWHLMERVFHPEARFAFGPVQGDWHEFVAQAQAIIEPCTATHHQLGQSLIVDDGPDAVIAETYMTAMHVVPAGYPLGAVFPDRGEEYAAIIAGRYVDRLVRSGAEWRIMQRTGLYDWREFRPIGEASLANVPLEARGRHDASDPGQAVGKAWRDG